MCVRDGEAYLGEALDSIADQERLVETIVIDDGSRDGSCALAASHRLAPQVVRQAPQGLGSALNHGLRLARGELLAFLDCDDVWPRGRLAALLGALSEDPEADAVYGQVVNTDARLAPVAAPVAVKLLGALLIRREAAERVGAFRTDIAHAAILDWISRTSKAALRFRALEQVVLLRRIHGDNMGIRERAGARDDLLRVVRDHLRRKR
jgi:glycosyltransferase involved in cell wall biosynthesis